LFFSRPFDNSFERPVSTGLIYLSPRQKAGKSHLSALCSSEAPSLYNPLTLIDFIKILSPLRICFTIFNNLPIFPLR
jgi:hypothetical protein